MRAPREGRSARSFAAVVLASCLVVAASVYADAPGELSVLGLKIKQSKVTGGANGIIAAHGNLTTLPPGPTFDATLGVVLRIQDSYLPPPGPLDQTIVWDATECATNRKGKTRCKSADRLRSIVLVSFPQTPDVFRFRLRVKGLAIDGPFLHPVTVTFTNGDAVWIDVLDECRATVTGLVCKKL